MRIHTVIILAIVLTSTSQAAEYKGRNVDGRSFSATAFSYDTGKYYYGEVEFNGTEATFTFSSGKSVTLEIDDEEIDDPSNISAFDYEAANYWDLDVDGVDSSSRVPHGFAPRMRTSPRAGNNSRRPSAAAPAEGEKTSKTEVGNVAELAAVKRLCVSGPTVEGAKAMRTALIPLLEDLVTVADEGCAATDKTFFIYSETEKFGVVALFDSANTKARIIFRHDGTPLQVVSELVKQVKKLRQTK